MQFLPSDWPNREFSQRARTPGLHWHVQITDAARAPARDSIEPTGGPVTGPIAGSSERSAAPISAPPPTAPVVLLLHGTGGSAHQWAEVIPALAHDAQLIAPDLPGHGFTERLDVLAEPGGGGRGDPMSLPGMAAAVGALLQEIGVTPTLIVGHSAGAAVALRMVLDGLATPRAVLGFNPALIPPPDLWVSMLAPLAGVVVESSLTAQLASWVARRGGMTRAMLASSGATLTDRQVGLYEQLFSSPAHCAAALAMMSRWDLPQLARDAGALRVPFITYAGEQDQWVPLAALRAQVARIPGATLIPVAASGHLIPEEQPAVACQAILTVLTHGAPR